MLSYLTRFAMDSFYFVNVNVRVFIFYILRFLFVKCFTEFNLISSSPLKNKYNALIKTIQRKKNTENANARLHACLLFFPPPLILS